MVATQLEQLARGVDALAERQRKRDELYEELAPILKQVLAAATERLDALEKGGFFELGGALANAPPLGLIAAARQTRDPDVRKGLGILVELLRRVGRAAQPLATAAPSAPALALALAPRAAVAVERRLAAATWTRTLAAETAAAEGVTLGEAHWRLLDFARADFEATGVTPNLRRITQALGVSTKEIYTLFPRAPGRTLARIAGLPKPPGCL